MINKITENCLRMLSKKNFQNPENPAYFQSISKKLYYLEDQGEYKEASRLARDNFQFKRALKDYELRKDKRNKTLGKKIIYQDLTEFKNYFSKERFTKDFLKN